MINTVTTFPAVVLRDGEPMQIVVGYEPVTAPAFHVEITSVCDARGRDVELYGDEAAHIASEIEARFLP